MKELLSNSNYLLLVFSWSMIMTMQSVWATVFDAICKPYGYSSIESGILAIGYYLGGIVGAYLFSAIIDKYKCFNLVIKTLTFLSLTFVLSLFKALPSKNFSLLLACVCYGGFTSCSVIQISYTYAVELTYPVKEPVSNGTLFLSS